MPDDYVGRPVPARAISIGRLVVVTLLVVYLVGMVVDFVVVATRGEEPQAGMALGIISGAAIQCGGWWTVIQLIRHR